MTFAETRAGDSVRFDGANGEHMLITGDGSVWESDPSALTQAVLAELRENGILGVTRAEPGGFLGEVSRGMVTVVLLALAAFAAATLVYAYAMIGVLMCSLLGACGSSPATPMVMPTQTTAGVAPWPSLTGDLRTSTPTRSPSTTATVAPLPTPTAGGFPASTPTRSPSPTATFASLPTPTGGPPALTPTRAPAPTPAVARTALTLHLTLGSYDPVTGSDGWSNYGVTLWNQGAEAVDLSELVQQSWYSLDAVLGGTDDCGAAGHVIAPADLDPGGSISLPFGANLEPDPLYWPQCVNRTSGFVIVELHSRHSSKYTAASWTVSYAVIRSP